MGRYILSALGVVFTVLVVVYTAPDKKVPKKLVAARDAPFAGPRVLAGAGSSVSYENYESLSRRSVSANHIKGSKRIN